jgi:hypothetical protein
MERRVYEELRSGIQALGGTMTFLKEGCQGGAWKVTLGKRQAIFPSNGRGFPPLDQLYTPDPEREVHNHYKHYLQPPIDGAMDKLVSMLSEGKP